MVREKMTENKKLKEKIAYYNKQLKIAIEEIEKIPDCDSDQRSKNNIP